VIKQVELGDLKGSNGAYRYDQKDAALDFIEVHERAGIYGLDDVVIRRLKKLGVTKSPSAIKADVGINKVHLSLKMSGAGKSSLINHQTRSGFIKIFGAETDAFQILDAEVLKYVKCRRDGFITEDVGLDKREAMGLFISDSFRHAFRRIFDYFVFEGTVGWGASKFPAESVLSFGNPLDPRTWSLYQKSEFYEHCWPNLVFSLRRHGRPKFRVADEVWFLSTDDNNPKGQLSLRI